MNLTLPQEGFCRDKQFYTALGISRSMFWKLVQDGDIPRPRKFGRCSLWPVKTARELIDRISRGEEANNV